ncbi:MAG: hypothetical protein SFV52_13340 [Saprospiraceae bacterium]|nr:hypothetical protein [Saprospiraceae bacterium]
MASQTKTTTSPPQGGSITLPTASERNMLLDNPSDDASKIVAFFEEMQKLMTGVNDVYYHGTSDKYREWNIQFP